MARREKYTPDQNGNYQTKVWDGTYNNGRKRYITLRSRQSSSHLEKLVNKHNKQIQDGTLTKKADVTLLEYAKEWKKIYKDHLSINTKNMYKNIIEVHIAKHDCPVNEVNRKHYHLLINSTDGNRTKQQVSMTYKQLVKSLIRDKYIQASSLADIFEDAVKIKYKAQEKRALIEFEKKAVFSADLQPSDKAFLHLLYGCGIRRGEALALHISDIDLSTKELTICRAIAFDNNTPCVKTPKTDNGMRTIPIPDSVIPAIEAQIEALKKANDKNKAGRNARDQKKNMDILFPLRHNEYISKSSYCKMWARIIKKMQEVSEEDITGLTAHIFRHNYCASLCYMIPKISIPQIARLLGDTEDMVINVYNHVIEQKEKPHEVVREALIA